MAYSYRATKGTKKRLIYGGKLDNQGLRAESNGCFTCRLQGMTRGAVGKGRADVQNKSDQSISMHADSSCKRGRNIVPALASSVHLEDSPVCSTMLVRTTRKDHVVLNINIGRGYRVVDVSSPSFIPSILEALYHSKVKWRVVIRLPSTYTRLQLISMTDIREVHADAKRSCGGPCCRASFKFLATCSCF